MTDQTDSHAQLVAFIRQESAELFAILRSYVVRMGLVSPVNPETVRQVTQEVMNEVIVEALHHADRYDPARQPMPWLLGIGINRVRNQLRYRANSREIPVRDLYPGTQADLSDDELFERFGALIEADPAEQVEQESWIADMLAHLSEGDRQIIRLAILNDLNSVAVARELGISPSAARVRLHRALQRLRGWFQMERIDYVG